MNKHSYSQRRDGSYQAQFGEDKWLERYFKGKSDGFYVDVGAYDGVVLSNTYHFEQMGWSGMLVEPNAEQASACVVNRPRSVVFQCAAVADARTEEIEFHSVPDAPVYSTSFLTPEHKARVQKYGLAFKTTRVPARTLDSLLLEVRPQEIDFVSIDAEEAELSVLQGFDLQRWRPKLIMIEENAKSRRPALRDLLVKNNYRFHDAIDVNHIYIPARLSARLEDRSRYFLHWCKRWLRRVSSSLRSRWARARVWSAG